jgi:hypothetical protein
VWVGVALLSALLLVTAELAEVYPLPSMALLLPTATVLLWYRIRYVDWRRRPRSSGRQRPHPGAARREQLPGTRVAPSPVGR